MNAAAGNQAQLIPGFNNAVVLACLIRAPRVYHGEMMCVSRNWWNLLKDPKSDFYQQRMAEDIAEASVFLFCEECSDGEEDAADEQGDNNGGDEGGGGGEDTEQFGIENAEQFDDQNGEDLQENLQIIAEEFDDQNIENLQENVQVTAAEFDDQNGEDLQENVQVIAEEFDDQNGEELQENIQVIVNGNGGGGSETFEAFGDSEPVGADSGDAEEIDPFPNENEVVQTDNGSMHEAVHTDNGNVQQTVQTDNGNIHVTVYTDNGNIQQAVQNDNANIEENGHAVYGSIEDVLYCSESAEESDSADASFGGVGGGQGEHSVGDGQAALNPGGGGGDDVEGAAGGRMRMMLVEINRMALLQRRGFCVAESEVDLDVERRKQEGSVLGEGYRCASYGGLAGIFGGWSKSGQNTRQARSDVHIFDVLSLSWRRGQDMLTQRALFACGVLGSCFYVAGGFLEEITYDFESGSVPTAQEAQTCSGKINRTTDCYDFLTDLWSCKKEMPCPLYVKTSVVKEGKLFVGGFEPASPNDLKWYSYTPDTDTWNLEIASNAVRQWVKRGDSLGATIMANKLYAGHVDNNFNIYVQQEIPQGPSWFFALPTNQEHTPSDIRNVSLHGLSNSLVVCDSSNLYVGNNVVVSSINDDRDATVKFSDAWAHTQGYI